jgi:hypothetical protein
MHLTGSPFSRDAQNPQVHQVMPAFAGTIDKHE